MDYLTDAFNRITEFFNNDKNLELVGTYHYRPAPPAVHPEHVIAHKRTVLHAMQRFLFPREITYITDELRRSDVTLEAILDDFFANDVPDHKIPFDEHVENGLNAMADAFRPPKLARPCHINDVEHHYPYKWNVNAEPPFSTDKYFLSNRHLFGDFYNSTNNTWDKYIDPLDMERRYSHRIEKVLNQVTPPKFGFMKNAVFSWTRRWHHVIKDGFTNTAGLDSSVYLRDRYIFPMLLHTKTAIVKKDDPNKMRTIWGCSKVWIIADTMLWWEYVAWAKLNTGASPMLWGYETFTGGWLRLNAALMSSYYRHSFLTIDWKRFDKRAYFPLIQRIMEKTRTFLDFTQGYVPNVNYPDTSKDWSINKAMRIENLWMWCLENLFTAPIVLPDGRMYKRHFAGIPSGLYITQLLDSWYNYTILATILSAMGINPRQCIIKVQGDDSITRINTLVPPEDHDVFLQQFQDLASYYFASEVSFDKSEIRNHLNGVEVLSYRNNHGMPFRDEISMLAQFYHTKARNPTESITMAQAIGFAYASCGNHERVLLVLKDVHDYYSDLGFTPNPAGLTLVFGNSPDRAALNIPLNKFPTVHEIKKYLTSFKYRNKVQDHLTWPLEYFVSPPCT
uniref:RNA-dependent RNA polymerase n=1 Tax=Podosphaera prunicola partitivirus 3 TaxID=2052569 RepID=A0A2P9JAN6_9VIRU|nr:RNA-dependent RNA polymerase [Podosphaera prunicola partitivirus 3]